MKNGSKKREQENSFEDEICAISLCVVVVVVVDVVIVVVIVVVVASVC